MRHYVSGQCDGSFLAVEQGYSNLVQKAKSIDLLSACLVDSQNFGIVLRIEIQVLSFTNCSATISLVNKIKSFVLVRALGGK